jgi:hypothetical protein
LTRAFISYSHDSEQHKERVAQLANRLRSDRIEIIIDSDKLPGGPDEGWPQWSERQVEVADRVLVVCTLKYRERYDGVQLPGVGLGAVCEASAIRQLIHDSAGVNRRIRVLILDPADEQHIPLQLRRYHSYRPNIEESYNQLLEWLRESGPSPTLPESTSASCSWPTASPTYEYPLADRKEEFSLFEKTITGGNRKRILLFKGDSNSGKTVLMSELLSYARHLHLRTAFLDFKGCPSEDDLFESFKLDLGHHLMPNSFGEKDGKFFYLISDLQLLSEPLILFFDTYQEVSDSSRRWIEKHLLTRLERIPSVVVVIGGQQVPEYQRQSWRDLSEFRELRAIRRVEDWLEYIRRKWPSPHVNSDYVKALILATRGNPGQLSALLETMMGGL